jgi:hypothetical protein
MNTPLKLLLWIDPFLLHYCLAYYIQQTSNHKLYSIIDAPNNLQHFFSKQNLVKFENNWFYHKNIHTKKQIDYSYLSKFEKKYEVNLWNLAINERIFHKYNEFYNFTKNEILSILQSECKFFEEIIENVKPDYLLTLDPGLHHGHLLTLLCKKNNIPVVMLNISKFSNQCYLSQSIHTLDEEPNPLIDKHYSFIQLENLLNDTNLSEDLEKLYSETRASKFSRANAGLKVMLSKNNNIKTHYTYFGRTKPKILSSEIKNKGNTWRREKFLNSNCENIIPHEKFVYLPLNQEPERSLLIDAPFYTNQIETIYHIAKSIPIEYTLVVKEHPTQGQARGWRPIADYKKILSIPNVKFVHHSISSFDLIKKSSLVITTGGSAAFEAQIFGKPAIIFANLGYEKMGSIIKVDCLADLPKAIQDGLKLKVDLEKLSTFVSTLQKHSFNFDFFGFQIRSGNAFFYNENLVDVEISEKDMEKFLDSEKSNLELLAMKHIEKIESYEKI